ncbi:ERG6 methyltransferase, partial [Atractosteus spatula]|nr:ERG6 methyltransferase [Atractosteus spatula]
MFTKCSSERTRAEIESGKVTLFNGNVMAMPLPDSSVDKVYHCNCYYFWPDLKAGTSEIHRVMKPGGLKCQTTQLFYSAGIKLIPELKDHLRGLWSGRRCEAYAVESLLDSRVGGLPGVHLPKLSPDWQECLAFIAWGQEPKAGAGYYE